jgi:hypothetical protein
MDEAITVGTQMMLGREFRITVGTTDDDQKPLQ